MDNDKKLQLELQVKHIMLQDAEFKLNLPEYIVGNEKDVSRVTEMFAMDAPGVSYHEQSEMRCLVFSSKKITKRLKKNRKKFGPSRLANYTYYFTENTWEGIFNAYLSLINSESCILRTGMILVNCIPKYTSSDDKYRLILKELCHNVVARTKGEPAYCGVSCENYIRAEEILDVTVS